MRRLYAPTPPALKMADGWTAAEPPQGLIDMVFGTFILIELPFSVPGKPTRQPDSPRISCDRQLMRKSPGPQVLPAEPVETGPQPDVRVLGLLRLHSGQPLDGIGDRGLLPGQEQLAGQRGAIELAERQSVNGHATVWHDGDGRNGVQRTGKGRSLRNSYSQLSGEILHHLAITVRCVALTHR